MRIRKLELKNFRGFSGYTEIDFQPECRNLLLLGENGSGKTSIAKALEGIFDSSVREVDFPRNVFALPADDAFVKITLENGQTFTWSEATRTIDTVDELLVGASKSKRFLDYKSLLRTYLFEDNNIFYVFLNSVISQCAFENTNSTFLQTWNQIKYDSSKINAYETNLRLIKERIANFNQVFVANLLTIKEKANEILQFFDPRIQFEFLYVNSSYDEDKYPKEKRLTEPKLQLNIYFDRESILEYQHYLNEARLSSIAASIFFSASLIYPESILKTLILDDLLIGLDMEHRKPILDILATYFLKYQILLFTYDPIWFSIVKEYVDERNWHFTKIQIVENPNRNIVIIEERDYLSKAKDHLSIHGDIRAAANYARMAFEAAMKKFCDNKQIKIRFAVKTKLTSEEFLNAILNWQSERQRPTVINQAIETDIRGIRRIFLNPLSHDEELPLTTPEVARAIQVVEQFKNALGT